MYDYKLSQLAEQHLEDIYVFGFIQFGEAQADAYQLGLKQTFERIAQAPLQHRRVDHIKKGYHRCVFESHSIYFRICEGYVEISAIIGAQDVSRQLI